MLEDINTASLTYNKHNNKLAPKISTINYSGNE